MTYKTYISSHGYKMINKIYEHRFLIERFLGRKLKHSEQIHHINGNKLDNRLENLLLCKSIKEHRRYDKGWIKENGLWYKICSKCGKKLQVNRKNFILIKSGRDKGSYQSSCKKCLLIYQKNFRHKKPKHNNKRKLSQI